MNLIFVSGALSLLLTPSKAVVISQSNTRNLPVFQGIDASEVVSRAEIRDMSNSFPCAPKPPQGSGDECGGSPNGCWGDLSIETDTETTWPNTGVTVEYTFDITNTTCSPDGIEKSCILINNQFPGPTIEASWGDWVKVTVNNQLQDNGTSIHWHGVRQKGTNDQDGVNGLTECPLAPGSTRTYLWQATTYGTSWYHSHFSSQYTDGVVGPIVIRGPVSAGYDIDMGPITVSEIYHSGGAAATDSLIAHGGPTAVTADNVLFNGKNINSAGNGDRLQLTFEPERRHLMRFVNTGSDNYFKVGLDGHMLQVVAIDFVPVKPYMTQYVGLGIGQRADVIVTANQTVGNYWLRSIHGPCVSNNNDGKGVQTAYVSYSGAEQKLPETQPAAIDDNCLDEPAEKVVPFVEKSVDVSSFKTRDMPISSPFQITSDTEGRVFRWSIGNTTQVADFQNPILQRLATGNTTITPEDNIVGVDEKDSWSFFYIQNTFDEAHPIHLHGNDLRILASGAGQWNQDVTSLSTTNPPRRDTFMVEGNGYTVLALFTDNPGVWLLHCHISWHVSEGLSASIYVRKDDIMINATTAGNIEDGCKTWDAYVGDQSRFHYGVMGSGLR